MKTTQIKKVDSLLRPFGVSVIKLQDKLPQLKKSLEITVDCDPATAAIFIPNDESTFGNLHKDIISQKRYDFNLKTNCAFL